MDGLPLLREDNILLHRALELKQRSKRSLVFSRFVQSSDLRRLELTWKYYPNFKLFSIRGLDTILICQIVLRDYYLSTPLAMSSAILCSMLVLLAFCARKMNELHQAVSKFLWLLAGIMQLSSISSPIPTKALLICSLLWESLRLLAFKDKIQGDAIPQPSLNYFFAYDQPGFAHVFERWGHVESFALRRIFSFTSWREVERSLLFWWILRDLGRHLNLKSLWTVGTIISISLTIYMVNTSLNTRRVLVDHTQYLTLLGWQMGLGVGHLPGVYFSPSHDGPGILSPTAVNVAIVTACEELSRSLLSSALLPSAFGIVIWLLYFVCRGKGSGMDKVSGGDLKALLKEYQELKKSSDELPGAKAVSILAALASSSLSSFRNHDQKNKVCPLVETAEGNDRDGELSLSIPEIPLTPKPIYTSSICTSPPRVPHPLVHPLSSQSHKHSTCHNLLSNSSFISPINNSDSLWRKSDSGRGKSEPSEEIKESYDEFGVEEEGKACGEEPMESLSSSQSRIMGGLSGSISGGDCPVDTTATPRILLSMAYSSHSHNAPSASPKRQPTSLREKAKIVPTNYA